MNSRPLGISRRIVAAQECDIGERGVRALGERYNFSIVIQRERATLVGGGHG